MQKISDQNLMSLALIEASKTLPAAVRPNPRVGAALLSRDGEIVSAHHKKAGEAHAEIEVLKLCQLKGIKTQGSVMAVSLEPCAHFGKTPPCSEALIKAGIKRLLVAIEDPNPKVSGCGIKKLREAGLKVQLGMEQERAFELNRAWLTSHKRSWPYVRIKMATSFDGLMSSQQGQSQWITGPTARLKGHELRARSELIITGSGTVKKDDPLFSARDQAGQNYPQQPKVWVQSRDKNFDVSKYRISKNPNFEGVVSAESLKDLLTKAYDQEISEVLVEAGAKLSYSFLSEGLFDELHLFYGACFLGGQGTRLEVFNNGNLPGLKFKIRESKVLDESNHYLILEKI